MSLTGALDAALSGIQASTAAVQIISSNVSNAQTTGYTDKTINLAEDTQATTGGVVVSGYSRVSDTVLSATLNSATSNAAYLNTQSGYMTQVQSILDSSGDPPALSSAISNFQAAWTSYSASTNDVTQKQAVISAGQELASTINTISSQVASLQTQVQSNLSTTVTTLNTDLAKIQTLNTQIQTATVNNQPTGDLEDQRDQAVNAVASIVGVQVMQRSDGQIALYTPGGTALVDGQAQVFSVSGNSVTNAVGADVTSVLSGGTLQAETDFLSSSTSSAAGVGVIGKITSQLENFTNMFVSTATGGFADTYNSATTATGELGTGFFTAVTGADGLPDPSTFAVNSALVNGTSTLKAAAGQAVSNTFTATNLAINTATTPATTSSTFSSNGLTTSGQTYANIATSILSYFQQAANSIQTSSSTATSQQSYYQSALSSETGVNTDAELVNLTSWQNSYAASAHVISTIEQMFTTLQNMVT